LVLQYPGALLISSDLIAGHLEVSTWLQLV